MSNQTEWNQVFGGEQEGADAWSELFRKYCDGSQSESSDDNVKFQCCKMEFSKLHYSPDKTVILQAHRA
jgi:hypothetical protein